jgi:arabinose-5-phosphate isomerase
MPESAREVGRDVVRREAEAVAALADRLGPEFDAAVERILSCPGRVILCGMGKSGQIAQKIASTLVSTGTPAGFLHPAEGFHGDVGIVTSRDVVVAVSNSGSTRELVDLVPVIQTLGAKLIVLTGPRSSPLARAADVALCWGEAKEADPLGVVPTVSSALTLALGDALTVAVMTRRGFAAKDYALVHPSGAIGRKLTLRVVDLLRGDETNPRVASDATFGDAVAAISKHHLGGVSVVDGTGRLAGLVTERDVRAAMERAKGTVKALLGKPVTAVMTKTPTSVAADALAFDALRTMESHKPRAVFLVPVVDGAGVVVGMINLHSLMQAGLTSGKDEG